MSPSADPKLPARARSHGPASRAAAYFYRQDPIRSDLIRFFLFLALTAMCGILCLFQGNCQDDKHINEGKALDDQKLTYQPSLEASCKRRGPHSFKWLQIELAGADVQLASSVLSLRGDDLTAQPLESADGTVVLAWNGQVYDVRQEDGIENKNGRRQRAERAAERLKAGENDAVVVLDWLVDAVRSHEAHPSASSSSSSSSSPRSQAFVAALDEVLSSIEAEWAATIVDVAGESIYYGRDSIGRRSLLRATTSAATDGSLPAPPPLLLASTASQEALDAGVQFAEVDCSSVWAYNTRTRETRAVIDRSASRAILHELRSKDAHFLPPTEAERAEAADRTHVALLESVRQRVTNIGGQTGREKESGASPPVAILFSGGLDSTLLAHYAHLVLPPNESIDLLNVAFENPRVLKAKAGSDRKDTARFDTPDRLLSRETLAHLRELCPSRTWRLVEINVTYDEYTAANADIRATMAPSDSVMDLSLASVLYFASRGAGRVSGSDTAYTTPARVYISGLGADELCGGYSRHRKAFESGRGDNAAADVADGRWSAVVSELQMDLDRLHTRNLGRDDRILSSHAREARYPFLAVPFIDLVASLPIRIKAELTLPLGQGEKYLLRDVARRCGLASTAMEKKRAMQWGARSAKMEVGQGKIKGHDKARGVAAAARGATKQKEESQADQATDSPLPPPPPSEIFTTMCYFPVPAGDVRGEYPIEGLLPEHLAERYSSCKSRSARTSTPPMHSLHAHIPLLSAHVARLSSANAAIESAFPDEWKAERADARRDALAEKSLLEALHSHLHGWLPDGGTEDAQRPRRVRLALDAHGAVSVTQALMPIATSSAPPPRTVRIDTQSTAADTASPMTTTTLQLHKTSSRSVYDSAGGRVNATLGMVKSDETAAVVDECFDVLMRADDLLTESSIANILVERADGRIVTPRLSDKAAFLCGVMREHLVRVGVVEEGDVRVGELAECRRVYLCNALRGVFEARVVDRDGGGGGGEGNGEGSQQSR